MNDPERPTTENDGPQWSAHQGPTPPPPPGQPTPQAPTPYAGPPAPPPYGSQPPYPGNVQPPYPQQPYGAYPPPPIPTPPAPPQAKRKVWPWVLGGCLIALVLGLGGCVGCMSCAAMLDHAYERGHAYDYRFDGGSETYPYDGYYDGYGGSPDPYGSGTLGGFTRQDIERAFGGGVGTIENGRCSSGVYEVGVDIMPGRYFLDGSPSAESYLYVFKGENGGTYRTDKSLVYFGNYYADLETGDLVVFEAPDENARMYPESEATFEPQAPYKSGLYLAGKDIPAGTYTITVDEDAEGMAEQECAAYVMSDLAFDTDSITDTKYVVRGGTQTVTIKDGEWLELYAATATPA